MDDTAAYVENLSTKPLSQRLAGYLKLTGPGYMQSAMTLGGGSVASCAALGSLLGYELLWVQPLAMLLGYFVLASVAKQTCFNERRSYEVFWNELHPSLAILWAVSAFLATLIWHIPQYSLTANGVITLAEGAGVDLDGQGSRIVMGAIVMVLAITMVYLYHKGAKGLKMYERAVKTLVWAIVVAFGIVVISTGVDFRNFLEGITGIAFIRNLTDGDGVDPRVVPPIIGGLAATVGINMIFLYPYSLLNKKWGKKYKELAYFDLISGMAIPFLLATSLMIIAVSNTIGPEPGEPAQAIVQDIREIIPVLAPTLGQAVSYLLVGLGIVAIGFSTIITHMLASGFIGCEMFGLTDSSKARWWFSLVPVIGVIGVVMKFPIPLAITASTLAMPLMPITVLCFLILLNKRSYMGEAMPQGFIRAVWNVMLTAAVLIMGFAALLALQSNWQKLQNMLAPPEAEAAALDAPRDRAQRDAAELDSSESEGTGALAGVFTHGAMATEFELRLYAPTQIKEFTALERVATEAFAAVDDLEARISSWRPETQVSRINRLAAEKPVKVSASVFDSIQFANEVWRETGGTFDITVGPLLELWGFYRREGRTPDSREIEEALQRVGMDKVQLDRGERTVAFAREGMRLDFGGCGKGLALDEAANVLQSHGIRDALIEGGTSTMVAMGAPPGKPGWTVQVRNPYNEKEHIDSVLLRDRAFSTSSCHEKNLEAGGKRNCHIINPRTGRPVEGVLSVSVLADSGARADALSTGFLVWGKEAIEAYCEKNPGVSAIYVSAQANGTPQPERINL